MSEAIVKVQRTAGAAAQTLEAFNRAAAETQRKANDIEATLADFERRRDTYRKLMESGRPLTPAEREQYGQRHSPEELERARIVQTGRLHQLVIPKAIDYSALPDARLNRLGQDLATKKLKIQRDHERAAAAAGSDENRQKFRATIAAQDPQYQALLVEQAQVDAERTRRRPERSAVGSDHLRRLGYSDDEIARMRPIGDTSGGPMLVMPPSHRGEPGAPVGTPGIATAAVGAATRNRKTAPSAVAAPPASPPASGDSPSQAETETLEKRTVALKKHEQVVDYSAMSEKKLRHEWQQNSRHLREQGRDIEAVTAKLSALRSKGGSGDAVTAAGEQLRDLHATNARFLATRNVIASALERRGYTVAGDSVWKEPRPPSVGGQVMRGIAAGGGFSGGGPLGMMGGLLMGGLSAPMAIAAGLTATAGWAVSNSGTDVDLRRLIFDTGTTLGGGYAGLRADAVGAMGAPHWLNPRESLGARLALARRTGRTDYHKIAALARGYGLPIVQTTDMIAQMGTLGPLPYASGFTAFTATRPSQARDVLNAAGSHHGVYGSLEFKDSSAIKSYILDGVLPNGKSTAIPGPSTAKPVRISEVSGIAEIVAKGYQKSAYASLPVDRRDALMGSYAQQVARLTQIQAMNGGVVRNFESAPDLLSTATRFYGPEISPDIPAQRVGAFMQGIQAPKNDIVRGVQMRAIMNLGREMSPEELSEFRKATSKNVEGGVDLRDITHARYAMQNVFSLPPAQKDMILRAIGKARRSTFGNEGLERAQLTEFEGGGSAAVGIELQQLWDKFLKSTPGSAASVDLTQKMQEKLKNADDEADPFKDDLSVEKTTVAATHAIKSIGLNIREAVMELISSVLEASDALSQASHPR